MPKDCYSCTVVNSCKWMIDNEIGKIHPNCPLVEVPEPHGRLIDGDELKTAFPKCDNGMDIKIASVRATISHMPVIIEAEGE